MEGVVVRGLCLGVHFVETCPGLACGRDELAGVLEGAWWWCVSRERVRERENVGIRGCREGGR